jgi:hypothetical protein
MTTVAVSLEGLAQAPRCLIKRVCSSFTPQMVLVVLLHVFTKIFPSLCMGARVLGFVGYVCSTNFYRLFYSSSTQVGASSQFLLCNVWLSPAELTWS